MLTVLAPKVIQSATSQDFIDNLPLWKQSPHHFNDSQVLAFLQQLSRALMQDAECKKHSELVALAFWLRAKNIREITESYQCKLYKALGVVAHFTPANVDTMFVYSWVCSFLAGNNNIVRVSSRGGEVQLRLLRVLNTVFEQPIFTSLAQTNVFVSYEHQSSQGAELSASICSRVDARVLWGGDNSVNAIRAIPCKPRCRDISFADRHSISLISAEAVLAEPSKVDAIKALLTSLKPYEQQACSSPRVMFWLGDSKSLHEFLSSATSLFDEDAPMTRRNEQLVSAQSIQIQYQNTRVNYYGELCAVEVQQLDEKMLEHHTGNLVLLCQCISSLDDIQAFVSNKVQTLGYWGIEKDDLIKFIDQVSITGIDRVVPLANALTFAPEWDGYELLSQLSRRVVIQ